MTSPKTEPHTLRSIAADSVVGAIHRGRKRRRRDESKADPAIQIGAPTSVDAEHLATPSKQLQSTSYHKRRRVSLIPGEDEEMDDDSNDEWEEHVDMDADTVEAAVKSRKEQSEEKKRVEEKKDDKNEAEQQADVQSEELEKERRLRERRRMAAKRKRVLRAHSLHLLLSIAHLLRLDAAADRDQVRALILSLTPPDLVEVSHLDEYVSRLALWVSASFKVNAMMQVTPRKGDRRSPVPRTPDAAERAITCAKLLMGDIMDVCTVVAALIRTQGYRSRIVSALRPLPHQMPKTKVKANGKARMVEGNGEESGVPVLYSWIEFWSADLKRWTPADLFSGCSGGEDPPDTIRSSMSLIPTVDVYTTPATVNEKKENGKRESPGPRRSSRRLQKQRVEVSVPQTEPRKLHPALFSHVVAVEAGFVTDVTRRYIRKWREVEKARAKGKLYEGVISLFQDDSPEKANDEAYKSEVEEFEALAAADELPTSVSALHQHPRFILERHVKKYEVIHPRTPIVGYLKDEPIFLRSNVRLLHTKDRWIRRMRKVMDETKPVKVVKSMNGKEGSTVDLFGEWQTTELIIPECVDGKIPKSVHGNVDLWTPEHLPKGTAHVNLPHAKVAARKLGVEFAAAMTGFEVRGGRSIPKIEGIVVAKENENVIRDAARAAAKAAYERQLKKAKEEAKEREEKAKREAKAREEVKRRFGKKKEPTKEPTLNIQKELKRRTRSGKSYGKSEKGRDGTEKKRSDSKEGKADSTDGHDHDYGEAECLKGDTWVKTCRVCGLDVKFEKL
eukprot:GFKZ01012115.1.p1 GENE.GFKZ01012115.1~~GFKZ01012115.1.p1  ORF type:complete len:787 (-),score=145.49 GFKZ01012115.1:1275-3635(-)